jgi:sn-glycerol 3-phosphate transport system substrate-binding protein
MLAAMMAACGDSTATTAPAATTAASAKTAAAATTAAATSATTVAATTAAATTPGATTAGATTAAATTAGATTAAAAGPAATATPLPTVPQAAGSIKVTFWYGLGAPLNGVVQQVVNKYNSSQTKYYIEALQQPDYDATILKLNSSLAGGSLPNVVQIYDIGTQRMIDTKKIVPVQDLIDKEKLDIVADIEPAVARYYTVNNKLYSMPFNSSAPVMYFDKNAFKEVGLDTEKKIWTYTEILDAAKKLTKKDASGKITRSGVDFTLYSWIFEQELATQGATFVDPANGRAGRANKLTFNNDAGVNWLNFLKKLQDDGIGRNLGRDSGTTNGTTRDANFVKGEAAITFNSIAGLRNYLNSAAKEGGKVDVGVAYLPRPEGAKGGVVIGGASLWITNTGTPEQQAGSWDFLKFTAQPEIQAFWSSNTGYYPIRKAAYEVQEMKDTLAKYPQFQVAVDQLRATEPSVATQGAVFGTFVSARQNIEAAMEQWMTGKTTSAKAALDDAARKSNESLDEYNSTVK